MTPGKAKLPLFRADLVIFDMDGTLADAFDMIAASFNVAMKALGCPEKTVEEVRRIVGTGSRALLKPFVFEEQLDEALDLFYGEYKKRYLDEIYPMPGALDLLKDLRDKGVKIATASNKRGEHCRGGLARLGMFHLMEICLGEGDVSELKPNPSMIERILKETGIDSKKTIMVGDSPVDVETAHAAGIPCICVSTGSHTAWELKQSGADLVISHLGDLIGRVERDDG